MVRICQAIPQGNWRLYQNSPSHSQGEAAKQKNWAWNHCTVGVTFWEGEEEKSNDIFLYGTRCGDRLPPPCGVCRSGGTVPDDKHRRTRHRVVIESLSSSVRGSTPNVQSVVSTRGDKPRVVSRPLTFKAISREEDHFLQSHVHAVS